MPFRPPLLGYVNDNDDVEEVAERGQHLRPNLGPMPTSLPMTEVQMEDGGSPGYKRHSRYTATLSMVIMSVVLVASCCSGGQKSEGIHNGWKLFSRHQKSESTSIETKSENSGLKNIHNSWMLLAGGISNTSSTDVRREEENKNTRQLAGSTVIDTMLADFEKARKHMWELLKKDWGADTSQKMFMTEEGTSRGRTAFDSPSKGPGRDRFKRKIMKKVLQAILHQDVSTGKDAGLVPFIWATGGHSAAAGHGNFYNESYTAIMEHFAAPVFAAAGLKFVGRNYAMGGTASGPEVSSCVKEIFGLDADVLSWDFGMTDGRVYEKIEHYFYRALFSMPNFPALVTLHGGQQIAALDDMQKRGAAVLYLVDREEKQVRDAIPDSLDSEVDVDTLPPYVKFLKCGSQIESGGVCGEQKFDNYICEWRKYKTSWHPGWRVHALNGVLNALMLTELLHDALHEISEKGPDWNAVLTFVEAEEKTDRDLFRNNQELTANANKLLSDPENQKDIDLRILFQKPNLCHGARLPAEIRHLGILTESDQIGFTDYDMGMNVVDADAKPNESEFMRLAYDNDSRQGCPRAVQMDYKDYFYLNDKEGWKKLVLPNDAEVKYYGQHPWQGIIAVCFVLCPWGHCPPRNIDHTLFAEGKGELEVNGKAVKSITGYSDHCYFLKHEGGHTFSPNKQGRFEIKARVVEPNHYMRISSFIIW